MPIYDQSYQIWRGRRRGPLFRWLAIPKFAYMELSKRRMFISMLTISAISFLIYIAYSYIMVNEAILKFLGTFNIPSVLFIHVDASFFRRFINLQLPICFILAFVLGANLISRDIKHNAITLYISKPISRWEYFIGKFSVLFFIFMLLTWAMPMILFVLQPIISPPHGAWRLYFWRDYAWIAAAITLHATFASTTLSLLMMAASSLTKNARYAGITFVIYLFGTNILAGILNEFMHSTGWLALSPTAATWVLGEYLFRNASEVSRLMSQTQAWLGVLGCWALCGAILKFRLEHAARYGR